MYGIKKAKNLTFSVSTVIFGLAAWYKMNSKLIPMPDIIPISNGSRRHAMNVLRPGIKSVSVKNNEYCQSLLNFLALKFINIQLKLLLSCYFSTKLTKNWNYMIIWLVVSWYGSDWLTDYPITEMVHLRYILSH